MYLFAYEYVYVYDRAINGSTENKNILLNILKLEKETTSQLKLFLNLKIFPSQEYLLMRKDIKIYKEIVLQLKNEKNNENEKNGKFLKKNEINFHAVIDYDLILEIATIEQSVVDRCVFSSSLLSLSSSSSSSPPSSSLSLLSSSTYFSCYY
jgi:hypothetical protein